MKNKRPGVTFYSALPEGYDERTRMGIAGDENGMTKVVVTHPDFEPIEYDEDKREWIKHEE